jgi:chromosome partitioning protein
MATVVTIINFKGGVGKTTCSIELSAALAKHYGRRTLLVDLDPQASATFYVMEQDDWNQWRTGQGTTYELFDQHQDHFPIHNAIVRDVVGRNFTKNAVLGFDLLPSSPDLIDVDLRLVDFVGHTILQHYFDDIRDEYDYIICDCPPNFNPVTKNSLWASDVYIVPTIPDFLSTYGIGVLQRSVHKLFVGTQQAATFTGPLLGGILLTRIKSNTRLHAAYREQLHFDYPGMVFKHTISDSILIAAAADNRTPMSAIAFPNERERELQLQFLGVTEEFISRVRHVSSYRRRNLSEHW